MTPRIHNRGIVPALLVIGFLAAAGCAPDASRTESVSQPQVAANPQAPPTPTTTITSQDQSLYRAAEWGDKAGVEQALKQGAKVNAPAGPNGWTALHIAAFKGHKELCTLLYQLGADVNARDESGNTPLHIGALRGHDKVCTNLLRAGADREAKNNAGRSPAEVATGHAVWVFKRS